MFKRIDRKLITSFDWWLVLVMLMICSAGLIVIYSAGYDPQEGGSSAMVKQAVSMGIGLLLFVICIFINPAFWRKIAWPLYIASCLLLLMVFCKGTVAGGARRWLAFGSFRMQPAEFTKITLVILYARLFSGDSYPKEGFTIRTLIWPAVLLMLPSILIMKQPDLGTALCHMLIGGSMLLLRGWVS